MLWLFFFFLPLLVIKHESWSLFCYHAGNITSQSSTYNSPAIQVTNATESGESGSFVKYKDHADILDSVGD